MAAGTSILATFNGGVSWTNVYQAPLANGPGFIGFETATQGVAIMVNGGGATPVGSLLMTFDGGHHWRAVTL